MLEGVSEVIEGQAQLEQSAEESELLAEGAEESVPAEEQELSMRARLGALLLVAQKPLPVSVLAEATDAEIEEVEEELQALALELGEQFGFSLLQVAGAWQLRTLPAAAKTIHRLIPAKAKKLSRAAAETLAVIAYKQPVQRAEIEAIRGVDALPTLKTLLDARLIRIVGRTEGAGHPALYGTTTVFLEKFGLKDLSELPTMRELQLFSQEPGEAEEPDSEDNLGEQQFAEETADAVEEASSLS